MIQKRHSQNFRSEKHISCHWSLSLPSENIRKTEVSEKQRFLMFSEGIERDQ